MNAAAGGTGVAERSEKSVFAILIHKRASAAKPRPTSLERSSPGSKRKPTSDLAEPSRAMSSRRKFASVRATTAVSAGPGEVDGPAAEPELGIASVEETAERNAAAGVRQVGREQLRSRHP
jgi:hypothetical protein